KLFEGVIALLTGMGTIDFDAIAQILIFLLCLYLISALLSYVQGWVMAGVATKLSYSMRRDISNKIDRMPLAYFDRVQSGE
ncbi:ABC transporter ATP-binding protein, partial [Xanthomonas citri pv. citri]|nr:ABC transporter ATP-binding protein [Xanthomonas citri pv. citri]